MTTRRHVREKTALGPWVVTADAVDLSALPMAVRVNGASGPMEVGPWSGVPRIPRLHSRKWERYA